MEIKKVMKESIPQVTLIGKRYTNRDRDASGTFASHWQEWFAQGWLDQLRQCPAAPGVSDDPLGVMRMTGDGEDGFEYWIGMFRAKGAQAPEGFASVEIPAGEAGVCWLYGSDKNGEIYSVEASDLSMAALRDQGWRFAETGWFFERYNCPRFTQPDEKGNVILDIGAYLV